MSIDFKNIVAEIDRLIRKNEWFDFHAYSLKNGHFIIAGGIDLTYSHTLEIIFENVHFHYGHTDGWHSDTSNVVFEIPEESTKLNEQFQISQGYTLFRFNSEDTPDIYIAASNITYNTDRVFYYYRPNLKENERLAEFVKIDESA